MPSKPSLEVLRDSAIMLAAATALLFVWGYAFESYRWIGASVPGIFQPEKELQDRVLVGGFVALFFFVPIFLVAWIIDKITKHHLLRWLVKTWSHGLVHRTVLVALFFSLSVALIRPVGYVADLFGRRLSVETITLKDGSDSLVKRGMYCLGKRAETYVFIDRLSGNPRSIFLVHEDSIRSLVLVYGFDQTLLDGNSRYSKLLRIYSWLAG